MCATRDHGAQDGAVVYGSIPDSCHNKNLSAAGLFVEAKAAVAANYPSTRVEWVADLVMTLTGAHFNYACDTRSPGGVQSQPF